MPEHVTFLNLPDCIRITNDTIDVIAATTMGPRLLRCGFLGGANLLGEHPDKSVMTSLGEWKPLGGHRLWAAPETMPASYAPDLHAVEWRATDCVLELTQRVDASGLRKRLRIALPPTGATATVDHTVENAGSWPIEIAPWALTIMRPGGTAVLPQPTFRSHDEALRHARVMALWSFTDLSDPRWLLGRELISITPHRDYTSPQKIGISNERGWCACVWPDAIFIKQFSHDPNRRYPDGNVNNEVYAEGDFLEVETLGPLTRLEPGESVSHRERWLLSAAVDGETRHTETRLHEALIELVAASGVPANA